MLNGSIHAGAGTLAGRITPALERIVDGAFAVRPFTCTLWDGSVLPATADATGPPLHLQVRSPRALAYILHEPNELGLGRAWVSGELELDGDAEQMLAACAAYQDVHVGLADRARIAVLAHRLGALTWRTPDPPAAEARMKGRPHSLRRDRVAVRHHYDVPTDFYRLVLGPSLVYSCAYYASERDTLEEAQERKLDLICRKLDLQQGERFLDVGCGWGSLLLHAARRYGVQAVGVTLSESQAQEARRRAREAGLEYMVEVRVADYREIVDGPFDKIASIGMYEHVGRDELPTYASRLRELLRPGGLVLNHGIARPTAAERSDRSFIWRYVFPDGELHPVSAIVAAFEHADLEVRDLEALREHYPLTLRAWARNLARNRAAAIAVAGGERERVWRLYMAGSALAFERGDIGVFQTVAARPGAPHGLPLTRFAPRRSATPRRRAAAAPASPSRRR